MTTVRVRPPPLTSLPECADLSPVSIWFLVAESRAFFAVSGCGSSRRSPRVVGGAAGSFPVPHRAACRRRVPSRRVNLALPPEGFALASGSVCSSVTLQAWPVSSLASCPQGACRLPHLCPPPPVHVSLAAAEALRPSLGHSSPVCPAATCSCVSSLRLLELAGAARADRSHRAEDFLSHYFLNSVFCARPMPSRPPGSLTTRVSEHSKLPTAPCNLFIL